MPNAVRRFESEQFQRGEHLVVLLRLVRSALDQTQAIYDNIQRTPGDNARSSCLSEPAAALRGLANSSSPAIGAPRSTSQSQPSSDRPRAHFQQRGAGVLPARPKRTSWDRRAAAPTMEPGWDAANRFEIGRDVVAGGAVTARGAAGEDALLIL